MGARNREGIGLSYRPAGLHSLAELVPWDRFLGSLKVKQFGLWLLNRYLKTTWTVFPPPARIFASKLDIRIGFKRFMGACFSVFTIYCKALNFESMYNFNYFIPSTYEFLTFYLFLLKYTPMLHNRSFVISLHIIDRLLKESYAYNFFAVFGFTPPPPPAPPVS